MESLSSLLHNYITGSLSSLSLLLICCSLFLAAWFIREIYIWRFHLRGIPGPFWNSISCYYTLFTRGKAGSLYLWEKELNNTHGSLVRVGPNHVLTDDPDVMRKMCAVRSPYSKSTWYHLGRFVPGTDSTISMGGQKDKTRRHEQRLLVTPVYYGKHNTSPSIEEIVDAQVANLVKLIDTKYVANYSKPLNFAAVGQYFALDVISALLWSEPFGFLAQDGVDVGCYVQTLEDWLPIRGALSSLPIFHYITPFLESALPKPTDKVGLGRLEGIAKQAIDERVKLHAERQNAGAADAEGMEKPKQDMLEGFISKGLAGKRLEAEVYTAIVNGSDSTATALRVVMALLSVSPPAYTALNNEITTAIAQGRISSPIRESEARALPYLQAVIRESLRLFPVPGELYKEVPAGGASVHNDRFFLPGGTWIGQNLYAMMRRRDLWGEDAESFRPERWFLDTSNKKERFDAMAGMVDMGFGAGQFQCLGKVVAWMELNKAVVEMLRRFDFSAVDPQRPFKISGYALYLVQDQHLRVTKKKVLHSEVAEEKSLI